MKTANEIESEMKDAIELLKLIKQRQGLFGNINIYKDKNMLLQVVIKGKEALEDFNEFIIYACGGYIKGLHHDDSLFSKASLMRILYGDSLLDLMKYLTEEIKKRY